MFISLLFSLIDEECYSLLQSDKKSIPSFRVLLEESLITYERKDLPLSELIQIVL
ncbi:MAG: hypothetical protein SPD43_02845 [Candidatus Enterosoma sp.]|nr:hypothetical protein [Candidatus Enterosoma sp.]